MSNSITRRGFVAGAVAAGMACAEPYIDADLYASMPYGKTSYDVAETLEYDIVIVGSGPAGMCAAMEAADAGVRVALVEKQGTIGGMSFGTEGAFGLNSRMQIEADIECPTVGQCVTDELVYTNYRTDADFWRSTFEHSGEDIDWLLDRGIQFDRAASYNGKSSFECFHWWPGGSGTNMAPNVQAYLETKDNCDILLNTECIDLVNEDGTITGIYAKVDDKVVAIKAPATVMCTGGFGENHERFEQLTGIDMSTGEAHDMMICHGAGAATTCGLLNMYVPGFFWGAHDDIMLATGYSSITSINQDGKRFMAEDLFIKKFCALYINALCSQPCAFTFFDQETIEDFEVNGLKDNFVDRFKGEPCVNLRA